MEEHGFSVEIKELTPIPKGLESREGVITYICRSLGLIPSKGKKTVAIHMLDFFEEISSKRDEVVVLKNGKKVRIRNGAVKIKDLLEVLRDRGIEIGPAQLYSTYLKRFLRSGLVVKKKYSMYGLRGGSLEDALEWVKQRANNVLDAVLEHARRLPEPKSR